MMAWQVRAVCACESLDACVNVSVWVWSCQKKEENHKVAVHPRQEEEWQKETTEYETSQVRRGRAKHAGKAPLHPGPKRKDNEFINTFISDNSVTIHKLHVGLNLLDYAQLKQTVDVLKRRAGRFSCLQRHQFGIWMRPSRCQPTFSLSRSRSRSLM